MYQYIVKQEEHHRQQTFQEEFVALHTALRREVHMELMPAPPRASRVWAKVKRDRLPRARRLARGYNPAALIILWAVFSLLLAGCQKADPSPTLAKPSNPPASSHDAVVMAVIQGDIAELERLNPKGIDLDRPATGRDVTPLLAAVSSGQKEMVNWLLDAGASIDAATPRGVTPLMNAIAFNQTEIAQLLIDRGANVNARNSSGTSILILAITSNQEDIAQKLIDRGADVNVQTGNHRTTALMMASHHDLHRATQALLAKGARTDFLDAFGKTALDYAKSPKMKDVLTRNKLPAF